jgi:hypothetical protein
MLVPALRKRPRPDVAADGAKSLQRNGAGNPGSGRVSCGNIIFGKLSARNDADPLAQRAEIARSTCIPAKTGDAHATAQYGGV